MVLALGLTGAAGAPDDLIRRANEAFTQERYGEAVRLWERAEERCTDPGLVAYNKGVALYRLGRFSEAAQHFRSCLEEAEAGRRVNGLYNLGNALVRQSNGTDAGLLKQAIAGYEECLRLEPEDPNLAADLRHNLELARQLWARARTAASSNPESDGDRTRPPRSQPDVQPGDGKNSSGTSAIPKDKPGAVPERDKPVQGTSVETRPQPGAGNQPSGGPVERSLTLSREGADEFLNQEAERIRRLQRQHTERPLPFGKVKDW